MDPRELAALAQIVRAQETQQPDQMTLQDLLRAAEQRTMAPLPQSDRPADPLRWAADAIGTNPDVPAPQFFMDPRALSLRNMAHSGLNTTANWLDGTKDPSAVQDQDMIAPLGLGPMGSLGRAAVPSPQARMAEVLSAPNNDILKIRAGTDPPPVAKRPFDADYPREQGPAGSPLTVDIDGRPLTAPLVAGRRSVQGDDVPLSAEDIAWIASNAATGIETVAPSQLPRKSVGAYYPDSNSIKLRRDLEPDEAVRALAHETAHALEFNASNPVNVTKGKQSARKVFHDLAGGDPRETRAGKFISPESHGYSKANAPWEISAELIRAYMTDPNYLKTTSPHGARAVRDLVNADPVLSKIVQFNADNAKGSAAGTVLNSLDMSEAARLARAREQGFDTERTWYHGTDREFDAFQPRTGGAYSGGSSVPATWMTSKPGVAEAWAGAGGQPGRVIDAHVAAPNLEVVERGFRSPDWGTMDPILQRAKEAGKDGVLFKRSQDHPDSIGVDPRVWNASDVMAMFNPSNIRSTQAAFDPAKRDSANLLAASPSASAPGLAASSTQQDESAVMEILRRYGLLGAQ